MFKSADSQEVDMYYQESVEKTLIYIAQSIAISDPKQHRAVEKLLHEVMKNAKKHMVPKEWKSERKRLLVDASQRIGKRIKLN